MHHTQTLQVVAASPTDYRMFYHSWDGARRRYVVGFATSSDALRWRKQGPIFEGGQSESDHDAKVGSRCFAPLQFRKWRKQGLGFRVSRPTGERP